MSGGDTFKFTSPPECPVFEPTVEEFEDAFRYIEKIRSVGEKYGLCKIRPPATWRPPFMVDHSNFKFTPRIQKLNEIEATSRVRVMFVINLSKFWQLQGFDLKVPTVGGKHLDFFRLKKVVEIEGGFEKVCTNKSWSKVAKSLHLVGSKTPSLLRHHYEKILYPYDIFLAGIHNQDQMNRKKTKDERIGVKEEGGEIVKKEEIKKTRTSKKKQKTNKKAVKQNEEDDVGEYICRLCGRGDSDNVLLLCDGCDDACHTFCLIPPLSSVPKGDWRCPSCVAKECSKPAEAYGFEQSEKEYTLESFTKMADEFKGKYFSADPKVITCGRVEEEFWRILSREDDVTVQYGADNPARTCGSGFPTCDNFYEGDERYIHSPWNLNNLPVLPNSVLKFIEDEVSGMKVPWCYVGMVFSCFSWHTEDHWSYSVNYMHWGEPKTWYGVPGSAAEKLENCMVQNVPELFRHSPDLMHQLTTLLNPNLLMSSGVPITRTDQRAGEFIITFPRAYHAGFNQGINFAEAVNYCPPDWIEYGRKSVLNYKTVHRQCVFSLDELFVAVSRQEDLNVELVDILHDDLDDAFRRESNALDVLRRQGILRRRQEVFEKLSDDERQCHACLTTCYLFGVVCSCPQSAGLMSCLEHSDRLCRCAPEKKVILYRHEDDDLERILLSLRTRKDGWREWVNETNEVIAGIERKISKPELPQLKDLVSRFEKGAYPKCEGYFVIMDVVKSAEDFLGRFKQIPLPASSVKTRSKCCPAKVSDMAELERTLEEMEMLDCRLSPERECISSVLEEARTLKARITSELMESKSPPPAPLLEELSEACARLCVELPEVDDVEKIRDELRWYDRAAFLFGDEGDQRDEGDKRDIEELKSLLEDGEKFSSTRVWFVERVGGVRQVVQASVDLRERAVSLVSMVTAALVDRSEEVCMEDLEDLVEDSKTSKVRLEDVEKIKNIYSKVNEWRCKMQFLLDRHHKIHVEELEEVLDKTKILPVNLKVLDQLRDMWQQGCKWRKDLKALIGRVKQTSHSLITKLFWLPPPGLTFKDNLTNCDMSVHFQQCKAECLSAIENIRKYNERCQISSQQPFVCHACREELGNKFNRCPVCRAPLHEKCLVDYYVATPIASGCPSCQNNGGGISLKSFEDLAEDYKKLNICLWDGEVLCLLVDDASSWQDSVTSELNVFELKQFCQLLVSKNRLLSRNHMPLPERAASSCLALPSIKFPKTTLERLIGLLLRGHLMDVDLDLCNVLSSLVHSCQIPSTRNVTVKRNVSGAQRASKCQSLLTDSFKMVKKVPRPANSVGSKKVKRKLACEECSCMPCKKPKGRKVNWVQCDKCDLWYHLICLSLTLENLQDLEYLCPACSLETNKELGSSMSDLSL